MELQFSVGDTVMVMKNSPCCNHKPSKYGRIFVVDHFKSMTDSALVCAWCDTPRENNLIAFDDKGNGVSVEVLVKVLPLGILEMLVTEETYFRNQS